MENSSNFEGLQLGHYGAILADPPWSFEVWSKDTGSGRSPSAHYQTMSFDALKALPVAQLAARDCCLLMWVCWPSLPAALEVITAWGFTYKTCGFDWMKADVSTLDMFSGPKDAQMGMGYWTRANTEPCLLAVKGKPKRLHADVRQGIISPRREHSRKPNGVHERIERLVIGPYCELFARQRHEGWDTWGNEPNKFKPQVEAC